VLSHVGLHRLPRENGWILLRILRHLGHWHLHLDNLLPVARLVWHAATELGGLVVLGRLDELLLGWVLCEHYDGLEELVGDLGHTHLPEVHLNPDPGHIRMQREVNPSGVPSLHVVLFHDNLDFVDVSHVHSVLQAGNNDAVPDSAENREQEDLQEIAVFAAAACSGHVLDVDSQEYEARDDGVDSQVCGAAEIADRVIDFAQVLLQLGPAQPPAREPLIEPQTAVTPVALVRGDVLHELSVLGDDHSVAATPVVSAAVMA
jgi:hypothetical protein